MKRIMLFAIAGAFSLAAQTQAPASTVPGCLSGPVTQGTLTVSCDDLAFSGNGATFIVKAVTTDPTVIGVRIVLATTNHVMRSGIPVAVQYTGTVGVPSVPITNQRMPASVTGSVLRYVFNLPSANSDGSPLIISGVTVQELKPSSSQSF